MTEQPPVPEQRAGPTSVAAGDLWIERRWRLFEALGRHSELFAALYHRAIDCLNERPLTPSAVIVAAHCIRDMANGLPEVIGDAGEIPAYSDVATPARELTQVWEEHETRIGSLDTPILLDGEGESQEPVPVMTVPVAMVEAARQVAVASSTATENRIRRRSALALGRQETRPDATVSLFHKSVQAFEGIRHPARNREFDLEKAIRKIDEALPVIEATLEARLGMFFASVEDLMDAINAANQRADGGGS